MSTIYPQLTNVDNAQSRLTKVRKKVYGKTERFILIKVVLYFRILLPSANLIRISFFV